MRTRRRGYFNFLTKKYLISHKCLALLCNGRRMNDVLLLELQIVPLSLLLQGRTQYFFNALGKCAHASTYIHSTIRRIKTPCTCTSHDYVRKIFNKTGNKQCEIVTSVFIHGLFAHNSNTVGAMRNDIPATCRPDMRFGCC